MSVIAVAAAIDFTFGEPRTMHPVRGMGRIVGAFRSSHRGTIGISGQLLGASFVIAGGAAAYVAGRVVASVIRSSHATAHTILTAAALKPTFAVRELVCAARRVSLAVKANDLERARSAVRHIVSRSCVDLTLSEVCAAAIESIAENFSDSVIAPWMAYMAGGLGAAYAYRFVNTADAMIGYRTDGLTDIGMPSARLDDLLNILPARTAGCLIAAAAGLHGSTTDSLSAMGRDAGSTSSPNAGWPMAAMAGALGVRLEKKGHYVLNRAGRAPDNRDLDHAINIIIASCVLALAVTCVVE